MEVHLQNNFQDISNFYLNLYLDGIQGISHLYHIFCNKKDNIKLLKEEKKNIILE
jgi:hypothetical protein